MFENHRSRTGEELDPETIRDPGLKESMTLYVEDEMGLMTIKVGRYEYPKFKKVLFEARTGKDYVVAVVKKYPFLGKTVHIEDLWIVDPD